MSCYVGHQVPNIIEIYCINTGVWVNKLAKYLVIQINMIFPIVISCFIIQYCAAQLTDGQRDEILNQHNLYRSSVVPEAANMKKMEWSTCLEQVAYNYLKTCPDRALNGDRSVQARDAGCMESKYVGENLHWSSVPITDVSEPIDSWHMEVADYDYNSLSCSNICGHYTQIVWADSYLVGCSMYDATEHCNNGRSGTYFLCNYAPGGNYWGQKPYISGTSCTQCPSGFNTCIDGMCAKSGTAVGM
nr:perisilin-6 [Euplectella curvistellata]